MKMTIKLNLGNYQSIDFTTNELPLIGECYKDLIFFLEGWVEYTENAQKLLDFLNERKNKF